MASEDPGTCGYCGKGPDEESELRLCSRCKGVSYCSRTCQKRHWKRGHKDTCQAASSEREDPVKSAANKTVTVDEGEQSGASGPPVKKAPEKPSLVESHEGGGVRHRQGRTSRGRTARAASDGTPLSFGEGDICAICRDAMVHPVKLPCGHWYCKDCIEGLRQVASVQDLCPTCRAPLPPGPDKLADEAYHNYMRVKRQVDRLGGDWSNLPPGLQREMDDVRERYAQAADQGHATAQRNLGVLFLTGQGVARDPGRARQWLEAAAAGGHVTSQHTLGVMFDRGDGMARDLARAMMWYERAAAQGDMESQFTVGTMYYEGEGVAQDFAKALEWLELAAAQGHAGAMNNISVMYFHGHGVEQDLAMAQWWRLAALCRGLSVAGPMWEGRE